MKRTVSALYETRADAERALEALRSHGLAGRADIHDSEGSQQGGHPSEHDQKGWLHRLFGGHRDAHVYGEGLARGHVLLTAQVDQDKEVLAAELIESAAQPLDLAEHENTWRSEGWAPDEVGGAAAGGEPTIAAAAAKEYPGPDTPAAEAATSFGDQARVRSYVTTNTVEYSSPSTLGAPGGAAVGGAADRSETGATSSS